jgi:putative ABC transport system substrate-binding protein
MIATGALCAAPLTAEAQQARKVPRVGYLCPYGSKVFGFPHLIDGLRELGWSARDFDLVSSGCALTREGFYLAAVELVRARVDVLVAAGTPGVSAVQKATARTATPVVFLAVDDPVALGIASSLRRPGGLFTGLSSMSLELAAKRVELLKTLIPTASRVAMLLNPDHEAGKTLRKVSEAAARALAIDTRVFEVRHPADYERAFSSMRGDQFEAVLVLPDPWFFDRRDWLASLATASRLPAVFQEREYVEAGGLLSYGPSMEFQHRRAAWYVDRILKGAKPRDMPIEQPTQFELVVNLNTAKALGITIPQSILLRADRVLE